MRRSVVWALGLPLAATGCALSLGSSILGSGFTPYSSTSVRPPVITRARLAYQGDIPPLQALGAQPIGGVAVETDGRAEWAEIEKTAGELAASYGGTHIILSGSNESQHVSGSSGGQIMTSTNVHYEFYVYSLPPDRWNQLPPQLNPAVPPAN